MDVAVLPLNDDNYGYIVSCRDREDNAAVVVDVSNQPEAVMKAAADLGKQIVAVLTTHKHWDHAGGNSVLRSAIDGLRIIGSHDDKVEGCTEPVVDGQEISVGGLLVRCIQTPGHTMGHICYFIEHGGDKAVFTGDTLFVGGCGKFFEGSGSDMYPSLYEKIGILPPDTKVYVGHEYTLSNYRFALSVDPDNQDLVIANERAKVRRAEGLPTVPSSIEAELLTNPFMRAASLMTPDEDHTSFLNRLREAKNKFK